MGGAIACGLCTAAFTFDKNRVSWIWEGNEMTAFFLGIAAVVLAVLAWRQQNRTNLG